MHLFLCVSIVVTIKLLSGLYTFFVQAEVGIRDFHVTGVQTCALPIFTGQAPAGLEDDTEPAVVEAPGGRLVAPAPGGPQARDPQPPRGGAILRGQRRPEGEASARQRAGASDADADPPTVLGGRHLTQSTHGGVRALRVRPRELLRPRLQLRVLPQAGAQKLQSAHREDGSRVAVRTWLDGAFGGLPGDTIADPDVDASGLPLLDEGDRGDRPPLIRETLERRAARRSGRLHHPHLEAVHAELALQAIERLQESRARSRRGADQEDGLVPGSGAGGGDAQRRSPERRQERGEPRALP